MTRERKTRVLIVDDRPGMTRTIAMILQHKGYAVDVAPDGPTAIEKVEKAPFDTVLMDIKMPQMDGVEAFRQIKQIRPRATVIMMTAYAVDDLIQQALDEGARGIFYKPVDIDHLLEILDSHRPGRT